MKREVSAAEAALIFLFACAGYASLGVFHPGFDATLVSVPTILVVEPLLVLAHELGHAAAAVRVTRRPACARVGRPPYNRRFSIRRVRVEYRLRAFGAYGGECEFDRSVAITGGGMLAIALAGPAANLLIALLVAAIVYLNWDASSVLLWPLFVSGAISMFMGLVSLIPQRDLHERWPDASESDHEFSDGFVALLAVRSGLRTTVIAPSPRVLFAESARRALVAAGAAARSLQSPDVGTDHLLIGLFDVSDGVAGRVLRDCGFRPPPRDADGPDVEPALTPAAQRAVQRAKTVLSLRGDQFIDTEHMLLGLIEEPRSRAADALASNGVDRAQVRRRLLEALAG